jgi:hypothetical protein
MYRKALFILALVTVFPLVIPAPAYARPAEWGIITHHVVRPGETIYCIGRGYGVSPMAIAAYNGIANPSRIYPGQVLAIPDAYAYIPPGPTCTPQVPPEPPIACACAVFHTVLPGQNLYRISLYYGVSMWRIADCNGICDVNYIRAGDVLCIPPGP